MNQEIFGELETSGLLLKTDPRLPSVAALVAGGPIRGSWWAHPMSQPIFRTLVELTSHPDVLTVKLISEKDTLVHRVLWPALLAVATSREPWQMEPLDRPALALLRKVDKEGEVEAGGKPALALEKALLVHGDQMHTEEGSHSKVLTSWTNWMETAGFVMPQMTASQGRESLERVVDHLNRRHGGRGRLPWKRRSLS